MCIRDSLYIFLAIAIGFGSLTAILKFKPQLIRKPILKKVPVEKRSIEEITSASDLKKRIDLMRDLKLRVLSDKELSRKQKVKLLKAIDESRVWDAESLKKERELILETDKVSKE